MCLTFGKLLCDWRASAEIQVSQYTLWSVFHPSSNQKSISVALQVQGRLIYKVGNLVSLVWRCNMPVIIADGIALYSCLSSSMLPTLPETSEILHELVNVAFVPLLVFLCFLQAGLLEFVKHKSTFWNLRYMRRYRP